MVGYFIDALLLPPRPPPRDPRRLMSSVESVTAGPEAFEYPMVDAERTTPPLATGGASGEDLFYADPPNRCGRWVRIGKVGSGGGWEEGMFQMIQIWNKGLNSEESIGDQIFGF